MIQGAMMLGVTRVVDFTDRAYVPLTMDADMSKLMALETRFMITGVVAREGSINEYAVNCSSSIDFMVEFDTLES